MLDPINPAKYLLLFWLLLASVAWGVRLTRRFIGAREPLDVAGHALAFSMLLLGVLGSWIARMVRHFPGTFLLLGVVLSLPLLVDWVRRRFSIRGPAAMDSAAGAQPLPVVLTRRERLAAAAIGLAALIPPLNMVWGTHLWDDWYFYLPLTSALSRNVFPVVYPFLPDRALTYHFGFAWLAAITEYHTGLSPEHCVDVISTVFLVIFFLSAAGTFRIWVGGRVAPYAGAAAVVGFGPLAWFWMLFRSHGAPGRSWFVAWMLDSQTTFADDLARNADYLLQKPMLAGMALLWLVMALIFVARRRHSVAGAAVAGCCVGMLELFQYPAAAVATVAGGAIFFLDLLLAKSLRRQKVLMVLVFAVLALGLPRLNGGFVANPQGDRVVLDRIWNFPFGGFATFAMSHNLPIFLCYVLYYGAAALVLPLVLRALWRHRSLDTAWVVVFLFVAFAVPHLIRHRATPVNITKFFQLSAFAVATLSTAGVLLVTRRWSARPRGAILAFFVVAVSLSTWLSSTSMTAPGQPHPIVADATVQSLRSVARWLRPHAGTHDRMFALTDEVEAMSGVLSPLPPDAPGGRQVYTVTAHGYAPEYIAMIKGLTDSAAAALDDQSLSRLKIRWVVLPTPLPPSVGAEARRRLTDPSLFQLRHEIPPHPTGWLIYEYLKGPPPGSLTN